MQPNVTIIEYKLVGQDYQTNLTFANIFTHRSQIYMYCIHSDFLVYRYLIPELTCQIGSILHSHHMNGNWLQWVLQCCTVCHLSPLKRVANHHSVFLANAAKIIGMFSISKLESYKGLILHVRMQHTIT